MQLKILSGRTLITIIFAGLVFFLALIFYFSLKSPAPINEQESASLLAGEASFGLPVRLKIPGISVDSAVESLGLASDGTMDIPKGPDDVAWFNLGSRPGENGSAVMAGHYGTWKNGKGSVFDNLHKLHKGDKIYVEDDNSAITTFIVRESRSYNPQADATDIFSSNDGKSHLNLVTCEGAWNKDSKSYPQRLVVFTDKE